MPNRADFWDPSNLAYKFTAEAARLLLLERDEYSLTTVQATIVIAIYHCRNGVDKVGWTYIKQAAAMAEDLGLMGYLDGAVRSNSRVSKSIAAWSVFTWQR